MKQKSSKCEKSVIPDYLCGLHRLIRDDTLRTCINPLFSERDPNIYMNQCVTERLSLYCSAPHHGWQFKALAYNWADQTLYWSEATNRKIQVIFLEFILNAQSKLDFLPFVRRSRRHIPFFLGFCLFSYFSVYL